MLPFLLYVLNISPILESEEIFVIFAFSESSLFCGENQK
nr:MAG TPA: hypothetical protein [Caudoviricetes sp.]